MGFFCSLAPFALCSKTVVNELQISVSLQIQKPANEVFDAIVDPTQMVNYFISQSSGRMEENRSLVWQFPEFAGEVPIRVGKIEKDNYISYYWDSDEKEVLVEMELTSPNENATLVQISEKSRKNDESGLAWLKRNTEGWANFLACLKAYLEFGINLRKGGFDFMSDKYSG